MKENAEAAMRPRHAVMKNALVSFANQYGLLFTLVAVVMMPRRKDAAGIPMAMKKNVAAHGSCTGALIGRRARYNIKKPTSETTEKKCSSQTGASLVAAYPSRLRLTHHRRKLLR